jgi:hypothetical protein
MICLTVRGMLEYHFIISQGLLCACVAIAHVLHSLSHSLSLSRSQTVQCPPTPAPEYPQGYSLKDLLDNWNPDDTDIPAMHYDSFCRFDFTKDHKQIEAYRKADVPVIITNIPEVTRAVRKWSDFDYLNKKLGPYVPYVTETSRSNHFMFSRGKTYSENLKLLMSGPTGVTMKSFEEWVRGAVVEHNHSLESRTHSYFRVTSTTPDRHWLYEEFPFFKPDSKFFHATHPTVVSATSDGFLCNTSRRVFLMMCNCLYVPRVYVSI